MNDFTIDILDQQVAIANRKQISFVVMIDRLFDFREQNVHKTVVFKYPYIIIIIDFVLQPTNQITYSISNIFI